MLKLTDKEWEGIVDLIYNNENELASVLLEGLSDYPFMFGNKGYVIKLGDYKYYRTTIGGPSSGLIQMIKLNQSKTDSRWPVYDIVKIYGVTTKSAIKRCLEDLIHKYEVRNDLK